MDITKKTTLLRKMLLVLGVGVAHAHVQMAKSIRSVIMWINVTVWHALTVFPVNATKVSVCGVTGKLRVQHHAKLVLPANIKSMIAFANDVLMVLPVQVPPMVSTVVLSSV